MAINTFPTIDREGALRGWGQARQDDTVKEAPLTTGQRRKAVDRVLDAISFIHTIPHVNRTDKATLEAFYAANKQTEFWWLHPGSLVFYLVHYEAPPVYRSNNDINSWNVSQKLKQSSLDVLNPGDADYP
jgi:hypothetical protein